MKDDIIDNSKRLKPAVNIFREMSVEWNGWKGLLVYLPKLLQWAYQDSIQKREGINNSTFFQIKVVVCGHSNLKKLRFHV